MPVPVGSNVSLLRLSVMRLIIFLCLVLFLPTGCNQINRAGLSGDLKVLFESHGVEISNTSCQMIDNSRTGYCSGNLTVKDTLNLIKKMQLDRFDNYPVEAGKFNISISELNKGCRSLKGFEDDKNIVIYWKSERPEQLRLNSGVAFEYLLLFQKLDGRRSCIQLSYSYG